MRPGDKTLSRLCLVENGYARTIESLAGQPQKIGIYHVGKGYTTRSAIMAPAVFKQHEGLLPKDYTLARKVIEVVEQLGYEIRQTQKPILEKSLVVTGGIVMQAEFTAMNRYTCAPKIYQSDSLKPADSIAAYKFSYNRIRLKVRWQLFENSPSGRSVRNRNRGRLRRLEEADWHRAIGWRSDAGGDQESVRKAGLHRLFYRPLALLKQHRLGCIARNLPCIVVGHAGYTPGRGTSVWPGPIRVRSSQ
jgi:hypothetical protein